MTQEIIYTSAPEGLKPGSHGFCTVISTSGMAQNLAMKLESMSAYRHTFPPHTTAARFNPVNYSHLKIKVGGRGYHILSRIADAGQDYTQRSNKLAHHVAVDQSEIIPAGPAAILATAGFSCTQWDGKVQLVPPRKVPEDPFVPTGPCHAWKQISGDAGWAGVVANQLLTNANKPVSVIFPKGTDTLSLVCEVFSQLPEDRRWRTTFSTYFIKLPAGLDCQLRFVLDDTGEATALRRHPHALVIDLAKPAMVSENNPLISLARTGQAEGPHPTIAPRPTTAAPPPVSPRSQSHEVPTSLESSEEDLVSETHPLPPESAAGTYYFQKPQTVSSGQQPPHAASWQTQQQAVFSNRKRRQTKIMYVLAGGSGLVLLLLLTFLVGSWVGKNQQSVVVSKADAKPSLSTVATDGEAVAEAPATEPEPQSIHPETPEPVTSQKTEEPDKKSNAENKIAEATPANTTKLEPEPAAPQPKPKPKHNPFQDAAFQKRILALPKWVPKQLGPSNSPQKAMLARINIKPGQPLKLEVLGSHNLLKNESQFVIIKSPDPAKQSWELRKTNKGKQTASLVGQKAKIPSVGTFTFEDGSLHFEWKTQVPIDTIFQYALLNISVDEDSVICAMYQPEIIDPFIIGTDSSLYSKLVELEIDNVLVPFKDDILLQILDCTPPPETGIHSQFDRKIKYNPNSDTEIQLPIVFTKKHQTITQKDIPFFKVKFNYNHENKSPRIVFQGKLFAYPIYIQKGHQGSLDSYNIVRPSNLNLSDTNENEWNQKQSVKFKNAFNNEEGFQNALNELEMQLTIKENMLKQQKKPSNELNEQKQKIEQKIELIKEIYETYPEQRKFFEETFGPESTGCRIQYRLFLKLEDHEIDLYRSREN